MVGPMLSDLTNLTKMFESIKFEIGQPVKPFQQLMACLPPGSSQLVPKPYRQLMLSSESPILDFYPADFAVDMNGKKNPWEGVNLLPFIEIERLKGSIESHCPDSKLTQIERERNQRGKIFFYTYDMTHTETVESPNRSIGLSDIVRCNSQVMVLPEYESENVSFKAELIPGTKLPFPGFPSLNVLPIASDEVAPVGVNCFGFPSKYPTMTLKLHEMPQIPPVEALADNILGKSLFINWPMMHEAQLVAISDEQCEVRMVKGKKKTKRWNQMEAERWVKDSQAIMQGYLSGTGIPGSGGVQIGEIKVRLKLLPLQGMKSNPANGSTKKVFGKEEADVPLQLALWQAPAPDPRFIEKGPMTLQQRFPVDGSVILTKGKYQGCRGTIVGIADGNKVGVKVLTLPPEIPFGLALARSVYESYISSTDAARILKLNPGLFGKITGSMFFQPGKYDLGLNLKSGDGLCVAGYTRKKREKTNASKLKTENKAWDTGDSLLVIGSARGAAGDNDGKPEERIQWEFTPKAIRLVNEYRQKFPQLFTALVRMPNEKKYDAAKMFGPNGADQLPVIREWLNNVESSKLPRTPISTDTMSQEAVVAVEKAAGVRNLAIKKKGFPKESLIKIPGSALFLENSLSATDVMLSSVAPELGDRIVNLCASGIPFGARGKPVKVFAVIFSCIVSLLIFLYPFPGIVVGIHRATTGCVEVVMDEEFVGGSSLQGLCSNFRGKLCVWAHVMRITVDNSNGLVDKLVPKGSGKVAIEKILSDIEKQVKGQKITAEESVPLPPQPPAQAALRSTPGFGTPTRAGSAGKSRSDSAFRGKLALSREAKGPPVKGAKFTRADKTVKSGLNQWKAFVGPKSKGDTSAELKAMPGVSSNGKPLPTASQPAQDASTGLKAMLGVNASPNPPQVAPDASAGLKAMLGVGAPTPPPNPNAGFPMPPPPPPPRVAAPPTAADKLMQLMSMQQPQMQHGPGPVSSSSSFNFSYVQEGKEAPEPPRAPQFVPQFAPQMHMPVPPQSGQMPMPTPPVMPPPNYAQPGGEGGAVVSDEEFPPLGGPSTPKVKAGEPAKEAKKQPASLVPSIAMAKLGLGK
jgi:hypothetical protein